VYIYTRAHIISTHFTCAILFLKDAQRHTVFSFKSRLLYASQGYSLLPLSSGSGYALRLVTVHTPLYLGRINTLLSAVRQLYVTPTWKSQLVEPLL
jgi:hypothetical protein